MLHIYTYTYIYTYIYIYIYMYKLFLDILPKKHKNKFFSFYITQIIHKCIWIIANHLSQNTFDKQNFRTLQLRKT